MFRYLFKTVTAKKSFFVGINIFNILMILFALLIYANLRNNNPLSSFLQHSLPFLSIPNMEYLFLDELNDGLPTFIWTFVLTNLLIQIWCFNCCAEAYCWFLCPFILMLVWELLQFLGIIHGYASINDVLSAMFACILAFFVLYLHTILLMRLSNKLEKT